MNEQAERLAKVMASRAPLFINNEAENEKLQSVWAQMLAQAIVSELGITEEMVHDLINMSYKWQTSHVTGAIDALSALMEVGNG